MMKTWSVPISCTQTELEITGQSANPDSPGNGHIIVCVSLYWQKYCVDDMDTPESIFTCLRRNKEEENFDRRCLKMVILREELHAQGLLMIEMLAVYRGQDDTCCQIG